MTSRGMASESLAMNTKTASGRLRVESTRVVDTVVMSSCPVVSKVGSPDTSMTWAPSSDAASTSTVWPGRQAT